MPISGRLMALGMATGLIAAGLALRLGPALAGWRLPLSMHHHGGGFLWGGLVCALVVTVRPPGWQVVECLFAALTIIAAVEGFRLLHTPTLDAFRLTIPGQWLLGRVFSPLNIVVDGAGAASVAALAAYCSWYGVKPPPAKP